MRGANAERLIKWARWVLMASIPLVIIDYSHTGLIDSGWLYASSGVVSSLGLIIGARTFRSSAATGWYALAFGIFLWVVGDLIYAQMSDAGTLTFPDIPDIPYLAAYPFLALGLGLLAKGRSANRANLIDAMIISTSAGLATWVFLIRPYATDSALSFSTKMVSLAYPVGDLVLLAVVCWFLIGRQRYRASLTWLAISMASLLISDILYGLLALEGTYVGAWSDSGYIVCYFGLALAALHPSMRSVGAPDEGDPGAAGTPRLSRWRLALLAAASLVGPALLVSSVDDPRTSALDLKVVATGTLLLFLLALMRLAGLMRAIDRNADQLELQRSQLTEAVEKLQRLEDERRGLLNTVMKASERERTMLAMDLHDGPIQKLSTMGIELELALMDLEALDLKESGSKLNEVIRGFDHEIQSLRELMVSLRPPALDERGLASALRDLGAEFQQSSGVQCSTETVSLLVDPEIETLLYRVVQEALTNVRKHAHATEAFISLTEHDGIARMKISDNGVGFDRGRLGAAARSGHIGLASIAERVALAGGTTSMDSIEGEGTFISISIPNRPSTDSAGEGSHAFTSDR